MKFHIFILSGIFLIAIASCSKKTESVPEGTQQQVEATTPAADTVTESPTPKTERPKKSVVETSLNTKVLFNTWVSDPEGPHADFVLSPKSFYVVDYDGDGDMPYILNSNKLTIYYEDVVQEADILSVSETKLVMKWRDIEEPVTYVVWKG
jgi:hypothetical protein